MSKENGRGPPLVTRSFKVCFPLQKIKTTNTQERIKQNTKSREEPFDNYAKLPTHQCDLTK